MTYEEAMGIKNRAYSTNPESSAIGILQGASFAFDPLCFLFFETLEDFLDYATKAMPVLYYRDELVYQDNLGRSDDDADDEMSFKTVRATLQKSLPDRCLWEDALDFINTLYWENVQTHWIGTFHELTDDLSQKFCSDLRKKFHGRINEESSSIKEDEVDDFIEYLSQYGN